MNLLLLTFGTRIENHYQAAFSILSFLNDEHIETVLVVTDYPDFYRFFGNKVECLPIDEGQLKNWQGDAQFFWRVKIKVLEFAFSRYPDRHLLYVDSDTFLASNLTALSFALDCGRSLMHKKEYGFSDVKKTSNTEREMFSVLNHKTFSNILIDHRSEMWNAGVIALPKTKAKEIILLSLMLCDDICKTNSPRRLVEQFSFSLALNHLTELLPCDDVIGHYWGNKSEWNQLISQFFVEALLKNKTRNQCVEELKQFDWNILPLAKKQRSTNYKLKKWIDNLFPTKGIRYFNEGKNNDNAI